MDTIKIRDIEVAYNRIKPYILNTPLIVNENINKLTKANVFFKLENLQWTGSFKLRGAMHKISLLSSEDRQKGVVAYSSGNHGQAVSYICKILGISSIIVMPRDAPKIKINKTTKDNLIFILIYSLNLIPHPFLTLELIAKSTT